MSVAGPVGLAVPDPQESNVMPFMVIYRTSDGTTRYEQSDAIDEAALFVERLRNTEGSEQIRIFRMEEINFAFRPYYKVELGMPERRNDTAPRAAVAVPPPPAAPAEVEVAPESAPAPPVVDTPEAEVVADGEPEAANGARRGLFGR